jgi:hypothetical protein
MKTHEAVVAVIQDLRWILRTCRVASVLPIETFEQMLPLSGVALTQAVHDGCAELYECIKVEQLAGNSMCAEYLNTTLYLVNYI